MPSLAPPPPTPPPPALPSSSAGAVVRGSAAAAATAAISTVVRVLKKRGNLIFRGSFFPHSSRYVVNRHLQLRKKQQLVFYIKSHQERAHEQDRKETGYLFFYFSLFSPPGFLFFTSTLSLFLPPPFFLFLPLSFQLIFSPQRPVWFRSHPDSLKHTPVIKTSEFSYCLRLK